MGANAGDNFQFSLVDVQSSAIGLLGVDVVNQADAAISQFDTAISLVSAERSRLGAIQNRLEHALAVTLNAGENTTASESRIRDVDMAKEMMNFSKTNILSQAATAMLAQANQQPQGVLQLLKVS
jgi:flagellin